MSRTTHRVSRLRLALLVIVGALAAAVLPSTMTAESGVVVASLVVLVTALVRSASVVVVPVAVTRAPLGDTVERPLHRPASVTDRVHHPIRPRAPGR